MRILWVSPRGDGAVLAGRIRTAGHQLVVYGEGAGLPLIQQPQLWTFAKASDLVVVDGSFPVIRTRRSWRPHQDALFFDELRRAYDITALGPTPTIDLLCGDRRYLRKWCAKLGISYAPGADETSSSEPWSSGAWFRANDVIPNGPYLEPWKPLFKSVGFRGYFELNGYVSSEGPVVTSVSSNWPLDSIPEGREADFLLSMAK